MKIANRGELSRLIKDFGIETIKVLDEVGVKLYQTITYNKKLDRYYRIEWGEVADDNNVSHLWYEPEAKQVWLNKSPWQKGWHTKEEVRKIDIEEINKKGELNMDSYLLHNVENNLVNVGEQDKFDFRDNLEIMGGMIGKGKTLYSVRKTVEALAQGKSVLFFSTETRVNDIVRKLQMVLRNSRMLKLVTDKEFKSEKEKEDFIIDFLKNSNLVVNDNYLLHTNYIVDEMRKQSKREEGLDYVIIDGLQLVIQDREQARNVTKEFGLIQTVLEDIGDELGCEILVTTQLNSNGVLNESSGVRTN